jgi:ATP-binding cassette subfamily D (ALD) protein 3
MSLSILNGFAQNTLISRSCLLGGIISLLSIKYRREIKKFLVDKFRIALTNTNHANPLDKKFIKNLLEILRIAIHKPNNRATFHLLNISLLTLLRTLLSIRISYINGSIVQAIVERSSLTFMRGLVDLLVLTLPNSIISALNNYCINQLSNHIRYNLTHHYQDNYLKQSNFNYINGLLNSHNSCVKPDAIIIEGIGRFSTLFSSIFSNLCRTSSEIILISTHLTQSIGLFGPLAVVLYYGVTRALLQLITPEFNQLTTRINRMQTELQSNHQYFQQHSVELAFAQKATTESSNCQQKLAKITSECKEMHLKSMEMNILENVYVKHGAVLVGYLVLGAPVFVEEFNHFIGLSNYKYTTLHSKVNDKTGVVAANTVYISPSQLACDYITNSSLLIHLARSVGRLVAEYAQLFKLNQQTTQLAEFNCYFSAQSPIAGNSSNHEAEFKQQHNNAFQDSLSPVNEETMVVSEDENCLSFRDVTIADPASNLTLLHNINFSIHTKQCIMISSAQHDGSAKLLAGALCEIYIVKNGNLTKPTLQQMMFIPHKPYCLPGATLKQQVLWPNNENKAIYTEQQLQNLLQAMELPELINSLNQQLKWHEFELSRIQRLALLRVLIYRPKFVVLDDCISACSLAAVQFFLNECKKHEIGVLIQATAEQEKLLLNTASIDAILRISSDQTSLYEVVKRNTHT